MSSIDEKKHETIKVHMLLLLIDNELTSEELFNALKKKLKGKFDGDISLYVESVKLDLEAIGAIEKTDSKPQRYRLAWQYTMN